MIFFSKITVFIKFVVSLTIVDDNPSLTYLSMKNENKNLKTIVFLNNRIKNDRYYFSKSSKRFGIH